MDITQQFLVYKRDSKSEHVQTFMEEIFDFVTNSSFMEENPQIMDETFIFLNNLTNLILQQDPVTLYENSDLKIILKIISIFNRYDQNIQGINKFMMKIFKPALQFLQKIISVPNEFWNSEIINLGYGIMKVINTMVQYVPECRDKMNEQENLFVILNFIFFWIHNLSISGFPEPIYPYMNAFAIPKIPTIDQNPSKFYFFEFPITTAAKFYEPPNFEFIDPMILKILDLFVELQNFMNSVNFLSKTFKRLGTLVEEFMTTDEYHTIMLLFIGSYILYKINFGIVKLIPKNGLIWQIIFHPFLYDQMRVVDSKYYNFKCFSRKLIYEILEKLFNVSIDHAKLLLKYSVNLLGTAPMHISAEQINLLSNFIKNNPDHFNSIVYIPNSYKVIVYYGTMINSDEYQFLQEDFLRFLMESSFVKIVAISLFRNSSIMTFVMCELFDISKYNFYASLIFTAFSRFSIPLDTYIYSLSYCIDQCIQNPSEQKTRQLSQILTDSILIIGNRTEKITAISTILFDQFTKLMNLANFYPYIVNSIIGVVRSFVNISKVYYQSTELLFTTNYKFDAKFVNYETYDRIKFIVFGSLDSVQNIADANSLVFAYNILSDSDYMKEILKLVCLAMENSLFNTLKVVFSKFPRFAADIITKQEIPMVLLIQILSVVMHCYFSHELMNSLTVSEFKKWPYYLCDLIDCSLNVKHSFPRSFSFLNSSDSYIALPEFSNSNSYPITVFAEFYDVLSAQSINFITIKMESRTFSLNFDKYFYLSIKTKENEIKQKINVQQEYPCQIHFTIGQFSLIILINNTKTEIPLSEEGINLDDGKYNVVIASNTQCVVGNIFVFLQEEEIYHFDPSNGHGNFMSNISTANRDEATVNGLIIRNNDDLFKKFINNKCMTYIATACHDYDTANHLISTLSNLFSIDSKFEEKIIESTDILNPLTLILNLDKAIYTKEMITNMFSLFNKFKNLNLRSKIMKKVWFNISFWMQLDEKVVSFIASSILPEIYYDNLDLCLELNSVSNMLSFAWHTTDELAISFFKVIIFHLQSDLSEKERNYIIKFINHASRFKSQSFLALIFGVLEGSNYKDKIISDLFKEMGSDIIITAFYGKDDFKIQIDETGFLNLASKIHDSSLPDILIDFLFSVAQYQQTDLFKKFIHVLSAEIPKFHEIKTKYATEWIMIAITRYNAVVDIELIDFVAKFFDKLENLNNSVKLIHIFLQLLKIDDVDFLSSVFIRMCILKFSGNIEIKISQALSLLVYRPTIDNDISMPNNLSYLSEIIDFFSKYDISKFSLKKIEKQNIMLAKSLFDYISQLGTQFKKSKIKFSQEQFISVLQIVSYLMQQLVSFNVDVYWKQSSDYLTADNLIESDITALSIFVFTCYYYNERTVFIDLFNKYKSILSKAFYDDEDIESNVDNFVCGALAEIYNYTDLLIFNLSKRINQNIDYTLKSDSHVRNEFIATDFYVIAEIEKIKTEFILKNRTNSSEKSLLHSKNFEPFIYSNSRLQFIEKESKYCTNIIIVQNGREIKTIISYFGPTLIVGGFEIQISDIKFAFTKNYKEKQAIELFLNNSYMIFVVFDSNFEEYKKYLLDNKVLMTPDYAKMSEECFIGQITLQDFLLYINFGCGRSFNTPSNYPIFPRPRDDFSVVLPEFPQNFVNLMINQNNEKNIEEKVTELTPEFFLCLDAVKSFNVSLKDIKKNIEFLYSDYSLKNLHIWVNRIFNVSIPSLYTIANIKRTKSITFTNLEFEITDLDSNIMELNIENTTIGLLSPKNFKLLSVLVSQKQKSLIISSKFDIPMDMKLDSSMRAIISKDNSMAVVYNHFEQSLKIIFFNNSVQCTVVPAIVNICDMRTSQNDSVIGICEDGTIFKISSTNRKILKLQIKNPVSVCCSDILMTVAILLHDGTVYLVNTSSLEIFHSFKTVDGFEIPRKVEIFDSGFICVLAIGGNTSLLRSFTLSGEYIESYAHPYTVLAMKKLEIYHNLSCLFISLDSNESLILNARTFEVIKIINTPKPVRKISYCKERRTLVGTCKNNSIFLLIVDI
ncbi:hypothetical protein TVAG_388110 [Trichomonas vaginalis G3]|uniref:Uncharacterized protein n=1 Tax=Trichomonas vaginalis (strain ATCC PRA-98 / G3) TaxID=412133 RepID=A2E138_TRIV3|nr:BEACH domain-containing protein family [Trichomonas vaginalis G3]EAY13670.1 hypothetical protein TVAG_388110 [Trichomonas vaginalis G3]KAI5529945.1 BEACH domain-containing protein family [Trichomonas vaginalis G3]|eukprot:XP_001325893.1 hypothetical protein [Trichomonas vaginalis G3]